MASKTIFYCWQSDLHEKSNHYFIKEALEVCICEFKKTQKYDLQLDGDARGRIGAASIPDLLLEKIRACTIFICDISIVNQGSQNRLMPNPNVMFELGYAVSTKGWEQIIPVSNSNYGTFKDLPFDFGWRGIIEFSLSSTYERGEYKRHLCELSNKLKYNIEAVLAAAQTTNTVDYEFNRTVAHQLRDAITAITFPIHVFIGDQLGDANSEFCQLWFDPPANAGGSEYPDPSPLKPAIALLSNDSILKTCNNEWAPQDRTWLDWFLEEVNHCKQRCDTNLHRFANRADKRLIIELQNLAKVCEMFLFSVSFLRHSTKPLADSSWCAMLQYLLQATLRSQRVWLDILKKT